MSFTSILFLNEQDCPAHDADAGTDDPDYFIDLNLNQVIDTVTAGFDRYDLRPLFRVLPDTVEAVCYRQDVMRDLETHAVSTAAAEFTRAMQRVRDQIEQTSKLRYRFQKEGLFLDAVLTYCDGVRRLTHDLTEARLTAQGWLGLRDHLADYLRSDYFTAIDTQSRDIKGALSKVKYCLTIKGGRCRVSRCDDETDYSAEIEDTFQKFQQGTVQDYLATLANYLDMNHIEANVLELVTRLYPDTFATLDQFCRANTDYRSEIIVAFDREVQLYRAYREHIARLSKADLPFCYPEVSPDSKHVQAEDTFDLALADKLTAEDTTVVRNDFHLDDAERIFVVTGPNQGGKTTFARTFGQLHYLARMGLPVPGRSARLFLCDRLFTHFEAEENITNLSGKLHDDLTRIKHILDHATASSVVIMNESFTSTTLQDALYLGSQVLSDIIRIDALGVYVTFVDELSRLGPATVSVASTVAPGEATERTYKIVRKPADGLAHAVAIAEKYGLTYDAVRRRITA
jgi:hypothetical protein